MKIYVGNLARETTEEELKQEFTRFGQVASVGIIKDRATGIPKGFAFVEMPVVSEGQAAIDGLKNTTLHDRTLDVNEARPKTENRDRKPWGHKGGGRGFGSGKGGYGGGRH